MLIEGGKTLSAPPASAWKALNDPAFLQRVFPGCRRIASLALVVR